jgi:glycosyltransferase involved in cell wall biosynthesis
MRNSKPLFSIVIVNYNHGQYLEETIKSILNQDCNDFELIIVDGGSKDKSVEIIKKYEDKLAWWISEKDKGQSDAFNKGFSKAKGEFFFWVNADDILLPNSIKYAKNAVLINPKAMWFAANTIFFSNNGTIKWCSSGPKWVSYFIKNAPIYVFGPSTIFHNELFNLCGGFDENLYFTMDTDLWMRFKNKGFMFKRIPKYFWGFRIHEASKTSHSFFGSTNKDFKKEQLFIAQKNNHQYTKLGFYKQRFLKIILGTFFKSKYDSFRLKGKNIYTIDFDNENFSCNFFN